MKEITFTTRPVTEIHPEAKLASDMFESSSKFMQSVNKGVLHGELGHPARQKFENRELYISRITTVDINKVSHRITSLQRNDDGSVSGTCVTTDTPNGKLLESMSDYKFGIRGFLDRDNNLNIVTFDVIAP